jgi:DNA (cytosine-5)-methyltransferase 3A
MNVLSVFDGISCGQIALNKAGIKVDNYYAAEIDKWAIQVTQANYPNTVQLGDVTQVRGEDLPRIDLLMGGSPCQGFSFAGKQLNFEDPRSKLFFEFVRLKEELKPTYFFLENVKMKKEYQDVITNLLGVEPIEVNSALVSAQNRKRLYWTNIPGFVMPEDRGILLKDIVHENCLVDRDKSHCIISSIGRTTEREYFKKSQGQMVFNINPSGKGMNGVVQSIEKEKCNCLTTNKGEGPKVCIDLESYILPYDKALKLLDSEVEKGKISKVYPSKTDNVITLNPKKTNGKQTYQQDRIYTIHGKMVCLSAELSGRFNTFIGKDIFGCITPDRLEKRQNGQRFSEGKKFYTLTAQDKHGILIEGYIRKLTPVECERLQTVPDNYTNHVSNSQRYKMLGNGWTVDVIVEFFKNIK